MKNLTRLTDLPKDEIYEIFHIADEISTGKYRGFLNGKSAVLFFPATSIRRRTLTIPVKFCRICMCCQKSEMILSAISICSAVKRVTSDSRGKRHPKSWDLICHNAARPDMKWMMSEYITI